MLGSLICGTPPRFPLPTIVSQPASGLQTSAISFHGSMEFSQLQSPQTNASAVVITVALRSASRLAHLLNNLPPRSPHQMASDILMSTLRLTHDILSTHEHDEETSEDGNNNDPRARTTVSAVGQLVRFSALTLVATVITTVSGTDMFCASFRKDHVPDLVSRAELEGWTQWGPSLKIWVLTIQISMESGSVREMYLDGIMDAMDALSINSWEGLRSHMRRIALIELAAMDEMAKLKSDIDRRLANASNVLHTT